MHAEARTYAHTHTLNDPAEPNPKISLEYMSLEQHYILYNVGTNLVDANVLHCSGSCQTQYFILPNINKSSDPNVQKKRKLLKRNARSKQYLEDHGT